MVKTHIQDLASMGRPVSPAALIAKNLARIAARVRRITAPRSPYRVGDAVVAEDPFNGRREGIVVSRRGPSVGVGTAAGIFYFDHRQLKPQE
ncbi:hypothetical protein [Pseudarthrobacter sp. DSP2-3-2b1]|uniref:hypothetical protein n=1 Tax=Pseudarthrobacter sp. DSP2-3-2b1 TaxID=2804661 RepID=UPI003CF1ADCA